MTVEQKHDPFHPYPAGLFDVGWRCIVCEEQVRTGDLLVPALHPTRHNPKAHYLCAVWYNDSLVSREASSYLSQPSDEAGTE